jgi:hypothetical protein
VPWFIAQLASSAAELENKSVVMCETSDHSQRYRPQGDTRPVRTVSEPEIRGTCNRLIRSGVNAITSYARSRTSCKNAAGSTNGRTLLCGCSRHQAAEIGGLPGERSTRFTLAVLRKRSAER